MEIDKHKVMIYAYYTVFILFLIPILFVASDLYQKYEETRIACEEECWSFCEGLGVPTFYRDLYNFSNISNIERYVNISSMGEK